MAHKVKNQSAMRETWVRSLGREDPLEEGMATHSNILAWRIPDVAVDLPADLCKSIPPSAQKKALLNE